MKRRDFIVLSGQGVGFAAAASFLGGCGKLVPNTSFDPGLYVVGSEHLIFDAAGSAYILDPIAHRVRDANGGGRDLGELGDGAGELNHPIDAAVGSDGHLYVLDRGNSRVQIFDSNGRIRRAFGGHGSGAGQLNMPQDIVIHGNRIYVCDSLNHRVQVFDLEGEAVRTIGESPQSGDRDASTSLNGPIGLAISPSGDLHVLDSGDAHVQVFSTSGQAKHRYGRFGTGDGQMLGPRSITAGPRGKMYVSDTSASQVHVFNENGTFEGRFQPVDESGRPVAPLRMSARNDGSLYIWTDGKEGHPTPAFG